jgi:two-component system chemotaxis sensor kinase CheA
MNPILEQFLIEARDNLDYLDSHLKELKDGDEEVINALFRAAHTLKGGAGLVGLNHIKEITHAAEDLLDAYRNKRVEYSDKMLDVLYDAFDEVIELVDAIEDSGDIDIDVDEERIEEIKREVRSFLNTNDEEKAKNKLEEIYLEDLTQNQLKEILPLINKDAYVIDLDLNEETIILGNDPFYLLSLFGDELKIVKVCVGVDFDDLLKYKTRMKIVVLSNKETIEDIFYNIFDEIKISKLTFSSILNTSKKSIQNETYNALIEDLKKGEDFKNKLKAALNVINPDTKEGFIVNTLYKISEIDESYLFKALEYLDINVQVSENGVNDKEKEAIINILKSQKEALKVDGAFERVRFALKKVASFMNVDKSILNDIDTVEELNEFIDEMLDRLTIKTPHKEVKETKQTTQTNEYKHTQKHHAIPKVIKIEQSQIDLLMNIIGEILVIKNSLPYIAEEITSNALNAKRELILKYEEISRIVDVLQDKVMDMRLLPLSYIFNRYPKLVREISKKLNKKIEYQEYGAETKLDKMIIEKLADPLVHVIRNSLDHGLEEPDERIAKGKSEVGILKVGARSEGDKVFIEISDDGRGIDVEKVVKKALEKRLIDPEKIDKMSYEEKIALIFLPGLSTKDKITDLSGRGVGADAIKSTVLELGGKINIKSQKDKGTTIILEIPISVFD